MVHPVDELKPGCPRVVFDRRVKLEFQGSKVTTDAGFFAYRELADALELAERAGDVFCDSRTGKNAIKWTRLSCRKFRDNAVRLQLHALAYNLGNFMRTLALPEEVEHWSLTTLRDKLVKIGAKVVRHGRYVTFQLAEVAVSRDLFRKILSLIEDLRPRPAPA